MCALHKITDSDLNSYGVCAAPDVLNGSKADNKAVFDRLVRQVVTAAFNNLVESLSASTGAGEIGAQDGSVQTSLNTAKASIEASLSLKADKAESARHIREVCFNAENGVFTFTREDGSAVTVDTALEKVAVNWSYDAQAQSLVLTLADGTTQSVPLSSFITETEFQSSDQIGFSVVNHCVRAIVKEQSITDTMLSSALSEQLKGYVKQTASSESAAKNSENSATAAAKNAGENANAALLAAGTAAAVKNEAAVYSQAAKASETAAGISADNAAKSAAKAAESAKQASAGQINADWVVTDTDNKAYIKNKPEAFIPISHASAHAAGGADALTPSDIGVKFNPSTFQLLITGQFRAGLL